MHVARITQEQIQTLTSHTGEVVAKLLEHSSYHARALQDATAQTSATSILNACSFLFEGISLLPGADKTSLFIGEIVTGAIAAEATEATARANMERARETCELLQKPEFAKALAELCVQFSLRSTTSSDGHRGESPYWSQDTHAQKLLERLSARVNSDFSQIHDLAQLITSNLSENRVEMLEKYGLSKTVILKIKRILCCARKEGSDCFNVLLSRLAPIRAKKLSKEIREKGKTTRLTNNPNYFEESQTWIREIDQVLNDAPETAEELQKKILRLQGQNSGDPGNSAEGLEDTLELDIVYLNQKRASLGLPLIPFPPKRIVEVIEVEQANTSGKTLRVPLSDREFEERTNRWVLRTWQYIKENFSGNDGFQTLSSLIDDILGTNSLDELKEHLINNVIMTWLKEVEAQVPPPPSREITVIKANSTQRLELFGLQRDIKYDVATIKWLQEVRSSLSHLSQDKYESKMEVARAVQRLEHLMVLQEDTRDTREEIDRLYNDVIALTVGHEKITSPPKKQVDTTNEGKDGLPVLTINEFTQFVCACRARDFHHESIRRFSSIEETLAELQRQNPNLLISEILPLSNELLSGITTKMAQEFSFEALSYLLPLVVLAELGITSWEVRKAWQIRGELVKLHENLVPIINLILANIDTRTLKDVFGEKADSISASVW